MRKPELWHRFQPAFDRCDQFKPRQMHSDADMLTKAETEVPNASAIEVHPLRLGKIGRIARAERTGADDHVLGLDGDSTDFGVADGGAGERGERKCPQHFIDRGGYQRGVAA